MTYQPGIPTGLVPLNEDYLNLQGNFTAINDQFLVDHVPLTSTSGTPPNGYHESIHFNPQSDTTSNPPNNYPATIPAATTGYGQLYSVQENDGINTDTALYWLTGGNRSAPITRNFQPVQSTSGYTYIPGGIIILWGQLPSSTTRNQAIVFSSSWIDFPVALINIQVTPFFVGADAVHVSDYDVRNGSTTGFEIHNTSAGPTALGFYWQAWGY